MSAMASQITSLTIVHLTFYSGADQRKHQRSAPLAFVWGIYRWPVNSPHKGPVTQKMFPFDDVIMRTTTHKARNTTADYPGWDFKFDRREFRGKKFNPLFLKNAQGQKHPWISFHDNPSVTITRTDPRLRVRIRSMKKREVGSFILLHKFHEPHVVLEYSHF